MHYNVDLKKSRGKVNMKTTLSDHRLSIAKYLPYTYPYKLLNNLLIITKS